MNDEILANTLTTGNEQVSAVREVLRRLLGERTDTFVLEIITQENGHDVYEYECLNGIATVHGTSGVTIARGAYDFLRKAGHVHCSWEGNNVELPTPEPVHRNRDRERCRCGSSRHSRMGKCFFT